MFLNVTTQHPSENSSLIIHKLDFAGFPHLHELSEDRDDKRVDYKNDSNKQACFR